MAKTRILVVHDGSTIRRAIVKALDSMADLSVASSSVQSDMLPYLIDQYKPDFILREKQPLSSSEVRLFAKIPANRILSLIDLPVGSPIDGQRIQSLLAAVLKEITRRQSISPSRSGPPNQDPAAFRSQGRNRSPASHAEEAAEIRPAIRPHQLEAPIEKPLVKKQFNKIIFCGASTGGTDALKTFLMDFPAESPPILITQHMPEGFTQSFADRLNRTCAIAVIEAIDHDPIRSGCAYIAPGHSHLYIERIGSTLYTRLSQDPPVNRHRPSVEVLFLSAAKVMGKQAVGVMFTGMGKDGALAMLKMREAGAYNIAQNEETSVVYGMPREAAFVGAVHEILPLPQMAKRALEVAIQ